MKTARKARQVPNTDQAELRRSSRLARKMVTMGTQGSTHNPENLPYYMEAVGQGNTGKWHGKPQYGLDAGGIWRKGFTR